MLSTSRLVPSEKARPVGVTCSISVSDLTLIYSVQFPHWWRHKEIDPWIIPCIIKSQSQIPADIWDATPSTTNTNEAQHHWTNSLTGTKLTPVEALESRRRVDQNVADEIKMSLKTGILSNSNNELSHRMARNSQRQSAVARRATESRDAANVSKDLQCRIDEEAEKRRLSNETTKFLKAQLKDAKSTSKRGRAAEKTVILSASSSGRVSSAPVQSDYVPSAPVATSTSGEELSVDEASSHRYSSPEPTMNTWNGNLDFDSLIYDLPAINTDGNWYFLQDPSLGSFLSTYNPASDPTLFMHSNTSTTSHAYPEDPTQNFTDIYGLRGAETAMPSAASPEDPLQDLLDLYGGAGSFPGTQATHGFTVLTSTPYLDAPLPILPPPPPESPCAPSPVVQQVSEPGSSAPRSRRGRQEVDEANIIHTTRTRVPSARKRGADDDDEADVTARPPQKSKGKHHQRDRGRRQWPPWHVGNQCAAFAANVLGLGECAVFARNMCRASLVYPEPKPTQARPKPWLPGQAMTWASLAACDVPIAHYGALYSAA
ncbi:hypothetical protein B0H10DRAFT_1971906 [Mycena sp. CBHHK59/15]|nr:hypothetical protein B0H10DRAFT_1971906 [Mycena sp. CBHHK59/15]